MLFFLAMKSRHSLKFYRDILMTCNHFNTIPAHLLNVIRFQSPSGHDDNQFLDAQVRNECQSNPITSDQKQCSEDFLFLTELNELSRYVIVHQIRYVTKIDVLEVIRILILWKCFCWRNLNNFSCHWSFVKYL